MFKPVFLAKAKAKKVFARDKQVAIPDSLKSAPSRKRLYSPSLKVISSFLPSPSLTPYKVKGQSFIHDR